MLHASNFFLYQKFLKCYPCSLLRLSLITSMFLSRYLSYSTEIVHENFSSFSQVERPRRASNINMEEEPLSWKKVVRLERLWVEAVLEELNWASVCSLRNDIFTSRLHCRSPQMSVFQFAYICIQGSDSPAPMERSRRPNLVAFL